MHELATTLITAVRAHVARAAVRLSLGFVLVIAGAGAYVAGVCLVAIESHKAWGASGVMGCLVACFALTAGGAAAAIAWVDRRERNARAAAALVRERAMLDGQGGDDGSGAEPFDAGGISKEGVGLAVASVCVVIVAAVVIGPRLLVRWGLRGASLMSFLRSLVPAEVDRGDGAAMAQRNGMAEHAEKSGSGSRNEG